MKVVPQTPPAPALGMTRFVVTKQKASRVFCNPDGVELGRTRVGRLGFFGGRYQPLDIDTLWGTYHLHDYRPLEVPGPKGPEWAGDITDQAGAVVAQVISPQDKGFGRHPKAELAVAVTLDGQRLAFAKGRYIYRVLVDPSQPEAALAVLRLTGKRPWLATTGVEVCLSNQLMSRTDPVLAAAVILFLHSSEARGVSATS